MAGELEKICRMLEDATAELQCAAAMVLGELKPRDAVARRALIKALKAQNDSVRLYAVEALARIDAGEALPHLVPLLAGPDQIRLRVMQVLSTLGAEAAKVLRKRLDTDDPALRKRILETLGQLKEVDTTDALFAGLLDPDVEVVKQAAQAFRQRAESLTTAEKSAVLKRLLGFMESPRVKKSRTPVAPCLLVVGALRDPSAAKGILPYLGRKQPPVVRMNALLALGNLSPEGPPARAVAARVLPLLEEDDFNDIVKPALDVLWKIPLTPREAGGVFKLLKSAHPQVRLYAARALGTTATPRAAEALVECLSGEDPRLSEMAGASLRANPAFCPFLVRGLVRQKDLPHAWKIANVLRAYRGVLGKATVRQFLERCLKALEKNEGIFRVYFEIVRSAAPDVLREAVLKKGRQLLSRKKFEEAARHLKLLERDDLAAPEVEFSLALANLRVQRKDLASAGRDQGPALTLFAKLARRENSTLLKSLQKESALVPPADLLYLGFSLIERQGPEREAGVAILKLVAKKHGSREEGKIARQKLKTQGVG